jgi:hypothetical protein
MKDWLSSIEWKHGFTQLFIAFDQFCNVLFFNPFSRNTWADETVSSRLGRFHGTDRYKKRRAFVDWLFLHIIRQGPNHCKNAFEKEKTRYHFHPAMRT